METLPVELIHRIFDNLDVETILFSIRPVCRRFQSIVSTYNRFIFNAKLISKSNFRILCRLIKPESIISLILSNNERTPDQIDIFILLVRLRQFTRLGSLTLLDIDECQLNYILKRINYHNLTSFTFNIRQHDCRRRKTTNNFLSSIFAQPNLRQVNFGIHATRISKFLWSNNCLIQSLIITTCINMNDLFLILQHSPHLQTISIKNEFESYFNRTMSLSSTLTSSPQLTSLTIETLKMHIDRLETFLSLTPSLKYLKLIGGVFMLDGKRWEQFIQINLTKLDKFEFYFTEWFSNKKTPDELKIILASFQTPFWIEYKKWFINAEYKNYFSTTFHIYSIPICKSSLLFEPESEKLTLSDSLLRSDNNIPMVNNVKSLTLTWDKDIVDYIQEKKAIINCPLFPKVTEINIELTLNTPFSPIKSLNTIINITQIVQINLKSYSFDTYKEDELMNIRTFLEQAHNLSSLIIGSRLNQYRLSQSFTNIYSFIPFQLKHIQIPVCNLHQIKMILERCKNLSTIKFLIKPKFAMEIVEWFNDNTIDSTCKNYKKTIDIWIGKKNILSNDDQIDSKRMKLNNDSFDYEMN